jgi:microcin C transport system substrate-binding protein
VPDFWGADLNTNIGQNNFDTVRYEYFRDLTVEFEAFKGDQFDFWAENEAKRWETGYDFPAMREGKRTSAVHCSRIGACGRRSTTRSISRS